MLAAKHRGAMAADAISGVSLNPTASCIAWPTSHPNCVLICSQNPSYVFKSFFLVLKINK